MSMHIIHIRLVIDTHPLLQQVRLLADVFIEIFVVPWNLPIQFKEVPGIPMVNEKKHDKIFKLTKASKVCI